MERHWHLLDLFHNRELNELYVSTSIHHFALSMITVFIPLYLLKLDYSLFNVFLFFAGMHFFQTLFVPVAGKLSSRIGFKHTILSSVPLLIVFYVLLYTLDMVAWPLLLIAAIGGMHKAFYWVGYVVDFSINSEKKKRGEEVGINEVIRSLSRVIGPAIGGIILLFFDFHVLFIIVSLLLFAATIPLFSTKDGHRPYTFSFKDIFAGNSWREFIAFFGFGVEGVLFLVIWPVFIYLVIFNDYSSVGFVTSLSLFSSLLMTYVAGKIADEARRLPLRFGASFNALIWLFKTAVQNGLQVYILDFLHGLTQPMMKVPANAISYDKANRKDVMKWTVFREMALHLGGFCAFLFMMASQDLIWGFFLAALGSLFYLFL